jgi:hypothetical protein
LRFFQLYKFLGITRAGTYVVLLEKWVVSFGESPVENDVAQKKCVGAAGVYDYFNSSFLGFRAGEVPAVPVL